MIKKMDFSDILTSWMRVCVFISSMSILVNGSPTKDFKVDKRSRQGDPLAPFLFLIAAKDHTGLVKKAVELDIYKSFKVHKGLELDILQYAYDTLLIGEGSWDILWSFKTIL